MAKPAVIILAAGEGTRMKSSTPKVLHKVAGLSLLGHAIRAVQALEPERIVVVVRSAAEQVAAEAKRLAPNALIAHQDDVPGTGRAVQCALAVLATADDPTASAADPSATGPEASPDPTASSLATEPHLPPDQPIMVIPGDTPRLDGPTLEQLSAAHQTQGSAITMLTALLDDPFGYGRVIRDQSGEVERIVEDRDATPAERLIQEINASAYLFSAAVLVAGLSDLRRQNNQGEVYLTDVVAAARRTGAPVRALICEDASIVEGVNDRAQLARAGAAINADLIQSAMAAGVTVIDPASTWLEVDVELESDVTLMPGTHLAGRTSVAAGAVVGPFTTLTDTVVGPGASVDRTVAVGAVIGPDATVGPFTYLRPGTQLGSRVKAGSFTELKAAVVGDDAKVPHLSYVGDARIGRGTNIGAGTIFANYDGVAKSRSEIGPAVRIGSNNVLVAPVTIGAGAYSGAGTIVRGDVPPGALVVSSPPQRVIQDWTVRRRPGSDSALAAESAGPATSADPSATCLAVSPDPAASSPADPTAPPKPAESAGPATSVGSAVLSDAVPPSAAPPKLAGQEASSPTESPTKPPGGGN
ncbi:MAG: bifunctional UDP-N-acetylglucosamine diphosphorylase/glucosamine-1-phosphate N-acetyltransferase GlmU [Bifidobacteriaceae bacterium]|jgi:bifunctional UDP-N-acetylglucosamine pyrophosphorylase/glucosamine-1-phosphate N-acetyltransferase|nr:bifunctional UDP-N-acetylglucosamine diphosphorylase/glucosamine-1-phosphate N-acetyltransferase GlmU [Bifidobacteriaceae bacterium]